MLVFFVCFQSEHNIFFIPFAAVYVSFCARQRGNVVYSGAVKKGEGTRDSVVTDHELAVNKLFAF